METLLTQISETIHEFDKSSHPDKRLKVSAAYILHCLSEGNFESARVELINNGDKLSKESKKVLGELFAFIAENPNYREMTFWIGPYQDLDSSL